MFKPTFNKLARSQKFVFWLSVIALLEFIYPRSVAAEIGTALSQPEMDEQPVALVSSNQPEIVCKLPEIADRPARKTLRATVTAYSSSIDETDSDPFTTASGAKTHSGIIAYNHLPFGTRIRFPEIYGDKIFVVEDRLRAGASRTHFDIWLPSKMEAKQWGVKTLVIEIL